MLAGRPGIKVVKSEGGEESGGVIKAGSPYNGSSGTPESTPSGSDYTPTDHTDQTESEDMMVYYCLFESKSFCPPFPPPPLWHALPFASCFRPCVKLRWTCSLGLDVALFHQCHLDTHTYRPRTFRLEMTNLRTRRTNLHMPTKLRVPRIQTDALLKTNHIQREIKRWIVVLRGRVQVGKGLR